MVVLKSSSLRRLANGLKEIEGEDPKIQKMLYFHQYGDIDWRWTKDKSKKHFPVEESHIKQFGKAFSVIHKLRGKRTAKMIREKDIPAVIVGLGDRRFPKFDDCQGCVLPEYKDTKALIYDRVKLFKKMMTTTRGNGALPQMNA